MAHCGLLDDAIEQARVHSEGNISYAASTIADLLAETGRIKDAVAVLQQRETEPVAPG